MRLPITTLLLAISLYAIGQKERLITLCPEPYEIQTRSFYIDSVIDNRINKDFLGLVWLGFFNRVGKVNFKNDFVSTLQNYLKSVCKEGHNQIPLLASIEILEISEYMGQLREDGVAQVKISFFRKEDNSLVGTYESTEKSGGVNVTEQHANRIKRAILNCLDQLSAHISNLSTQATYPDDTTWFSNFQGLRHHRQSDEYFEGEGHEIFIKTISYKLDKKGLEKLSRKYDLKSYQSSTDSKLKLAVFTKQELVNGVHGHHSLYLVPSSSGYTKLIGFAHASEQDIELERRFVQAYRSGAIPYHVYTKSEIDSINFVGRTIHPDSYCRWMGPHNIQSPNLGQMNWSIFNSIQDAEAYRDSHIALTKGKNMINTIDETWVPVKFEGIETKALRIKVQIKVPKAAMGGSNTLVVYYVTSQVRSKFVTAVLSQYTYNPDNNRLAPLLAEILTLQSPDGAWQEDRKISALNDYEAHDSVTVQEQAEMKKPEEYSSVKFETGTWIPVGNMATKVGISPSFGIYGAFINNPELPFRVDFGLSLLIPTNTKPFRYQDRDTTFITKMGAPVGFFSMHITTKKVLTNRNFIDYVDQVFGVGIGAFPTTTEEPKKKPKDLDSNYTFTAPNLCYGLTFRKKIWSHHSIGFVFRYNFTPTGWFNSPVESSFGKSSFTTGIELRL